MKTCIIACLALVSVSCAHAGDIFRQVSSMEKDKYVHFCAGVLVSHVSYPYFYGSLQDRRAAAGYSVLLAAALGLCKELCDIRTTGFDAGDWAAGVAGGCTVLMVSF